jgi:hypothetical protein
MSFIDIMQTYFRGEKLEALWFILPIGVLLVAFGAVALKAERGGFAWGIAIPCFLFGIVLIATGAGVAMRTPGQVAEIKEGFEQAPATMVQKELPRIQKVNTNFKVTFIAFGVVAAIGLALIYLVNTDWAKGLGSVLVLVGAIGFLIDGFAERRAVPYTSALVELAKHHEVVR